MEAKQFIENIKLEVDLRDLRPDERHGTLLAMYRSLKPEEGFVLVDQSDPMPYLNILQRLHSGEFDWFPLSIRPGEWRTGLARRATKLSNPQKVSKFMTEDHLRMTLLLQHIKRLAEGGDLEEAGRVCGFLSTILTRHIRIEEEVLFALFNAARKNLPEWHSLDLCKEHRQVVQMARRLGQVLEDAAGAQVTSTQMAEVKDLAGTLEAHFDSHVGKEERLLYTWINMLLEPAQVDLLVNRLQALAAPPTHASEPGHA